MTTERYSDITYESGLTEGTPCWLEIATPHAEATMRFYSTVFGWEYETRMDATGNTYTVATLFGEPVAGLVGSERAVLDWTLYLATSDLEWAQREAVRFGGSIVSGTQRVPGVGTKVLAADASSAHIGLCEPSADWALSTGVPGTLVWAELVTRQATLADRFFRRLFGFEQRQFGDGRQIDYTVWYAGEDSVIGRARMVRGTPDYVPPRWIAHFAVDPDVGFNDALYNARMHGATMRFKPYDSNLGKVAVLSDPLGTRFALIDPTLAAPWQYGSGADDPYDD